MNPESFFQKLFCQEPKKELEKTQQTLRELQSKYNKVKDELQVEKNKRQELGKRLDDKEQELTETIDQLKATEDILRSKRQRIGELKATKERDTSVTEFLDENYERRERPRYEDKRTFNGEQISIYADELIDPECYAVKHLYKNSRATQHVDILAKSVQDVVTDEITWTSDTTLSSTGDYYLHPRETINRGKGDCEDISFVASSAAPYLLPVAWGYIGPNGHAFNVTVIGDELYVVDCSEETTTFEPYSETDQYEIHFISTKGRAWDAKPDSNVVFGDVAEEIHA